MSLQELLSESLDAESNDVWERERTATPVRAFAVRLHSAGLSLRETAAILDLLGVDRSHQAIWQWTHRLTEKHDLDETMFLVDGYGYATALARLGLSGQRDYTERNHIERWFQTFKVRTDRFHTSWVGSRQAVRDWCRKFRRYYNRQRPHQALKGKTPIELI